MLRIISKVERGVGLLKDLLKIERLYDYFYRGMYQFALYNINTMESRGYYTRKFFRLLLLYRE